jgi:hypothetical protein
MFGFPLFNHFESPEDLEASENKEEVFFTQSSTGNFDIYILKTLRSRKRSAKYSMR